MINIVENFLHGRPSHNRITPSNGNAEASDREIVMDKQGVAYDNELIDGLRQEHETLIEQFGFILKSGYEPGDLELLCENLGEFKRLFQSHLATENVKLFGYLEQKMKQHTPEVDLMLSFRREINECSKMVISFCKKYARPIDALVLHDTFKDDYRDAGQALIHRVQFIEKEMYSLYRNIYKVDFSL